jgi:hypothetical protein
MRLTPSIWRETAVGDRFWVRESLGWGKVAGRLFYRADGVPVTNWAPVTMPGSEGGADNERHFDPL